MVVLAASVLMVVIVVCESSFTLSMVLVVVRSPRPVALRSVVLCNTKDSQLMKTVTYRFLNMLVTNTIFPINSSSVN